jgi:AcrR family transcriptional regulator
MAASKSETGAAKAKRSKASKAAKAPSKSKGRPAYEPTQRDREQVEALAGYGLRADQIADTIGVARSTLFKHFADEIKRGGAVASGRVHQTAYQMATSGRHPASTMFWLKCRAGWRETNVLEIAKLPKLEVVVSKD